MYLFPASPFCLPDSDCRLRVAIGLGERYNEDRCEEGCASGSWPRRGRYLVLLEFLSHKCPHWLVLGRWWWTELVLAAGGLIEAQVAWGEAYVSMRDGEGEQ